MIRSLDKTVLSMIERCGVQFIRDADLKSMSRWGIGGFARILLKPQNEYELSRLLELLSAESVDYVLIGSTSNLLFDSAGIDVPIIQLSGDFKKMAVDNHVLTVGAAAFVPCVARIAAKHGLSGIEHIVGIPGSFGGLVCMNGGSARKSISDNIQSVQFVESNGEIKTIDIENCKFSYRHSEFQHGSRVIASAKLRFHDFKAPSQIRQKMLSILSERNKKFPRKMMNCGSVFLSTAEMHASIGPPGAVIERLSLKGFRIGGAVVSDQHANFINNSGNATSDDVIDLINMVRLRVYEKTHFMMNTEAKYVQKDGRITSISDLLDKK